MSEELKLDPENQYIGDLMILQVLADSEDVNDQEREVLLRWIENSQPPASRDAEVQRLRDALAEIAEETSGSRSSLIERDRAYCIASAALKEQQ
jgi:hypothetical protein